MKSGIYKITNTQNNKVYIGSAANIDKRKRGHFGKLKNNKHENRYLQNAWNKYGPENFKFEILEYIGLDNLIEQEQLYIDFYKSAQRKFGYNICPAAESHLGLKFSEEICKKLSDAHKGEKCYWYGKHLSEEHRKKLSIANIGNIVGEKHSCSKLTWKQVKEIRKQHQEKDISYDELANIYHVAKCTIANIILNNTWKDKDYQFVKKRKLTLEQIVEIKQKYAKGDISQKRLSKEYNVSQELISEIVRNRIYKK